MAHHLAGWINPLQMGLLSGIGQWGQAMEKSNLMDRQLQGRLAAYQAKYGAMATIQQQREQNNQVLKMLQLERQNQRGYDVSETGPDGKYYKVHYATVYNPETKGWDRVEQGRVPLPPDAGTLLATREAAIDARADARQGAQDARQSAREKAQDTREESKEQAHKLDLLDSRVDRDMSAFDKADADTQAKMLKAAGVSDTLTTANPAAGQRSLAHPFSGEPDTVTTPNDDARAQYEAAITAKHAKQLGIKPTTDNAAPAPAPQGHPDLTPDGREIRYDASGTPYVKDANGKPVPYSPTGSTPLAMDADQAAPAAAAAEPDEGEDDQQSPLLASADEPQGNAMDSEESNAEDEQDDQNEDALLA